MEGGYLQALIKKFTGQDAHPPPPLPSPPPLCSSAAPVSRLKSLKAQLRGDPKKLVSHRLGERLLGHTQLRDENKRTLAFRREIYGRLTLKQFDLLCELMELIKKSSGAGEELAAEMFEDGAEPGLQIIDFILKHPECLPTRETKQQPEQKPAKFSKELMLKMYYSQVDSAMIKRQNDCLLQLLRRPGKKTVKPEGDQLSVSSCPDDSAKESLIQPLVPPPVPKPRRGITQAEKDMLAFSQVMTQDGRLDVTRRTTELWHRAPTRERVAFWQMKDSNKK